MTYPAGDDAGEYPITEWLVDGVWEDVSDRVRGDITVSPRGRQNEQGTIAPTQVTGLPMDNTDFLFANKSPASAWYGKIPAGTQIRHRAGDGNNHLYMRYNTDSTNTSTDDNTKAVTVDKAALDITGDLEVRVEVRPHTWRPTRNMILTAKYRTTGNQRSWVFYLGTTGRIFLHWSPDGTFASSIAVGSTVSVPATSGRLALRVTIDVNNGAAGNTVRFYTATSIGGTYTQLGADVVTAGTTSVFSSTADLVIGGGHPGELSAIYGNGVGYGGRFYGMHLYNSAGTRVANPDFSLWDLDDTAVVDSHSNTWTLSGQARITSPRVRFWGELVTVGHATDPSENDTLAEVDEADLTQALSTGQTVVKSPLELNIAPRAGLLGYWRFEDLETSTQAASALPAPSRAAPVWDVTFGQSSDLPGAARVATFPETTSKARFQFLKGTGTGFWQMVCLFKVSSLPAAEASLIGLECSGAVKQMKFQIGPTTFRTQFFGWDPSTTIGGGNSTFGAGVVVEDEWIAVRVQVEQNGANVDWATAWYQQGSGVFWGTSGSFVAPSVGQPTSALIQTGKDTAFNGVQIAHFVVSEQDMEFANGLTAWSTAIDAYAGERATTRLRRIADNADLYLEITGDGESSALVGAQPIKTPMDVFLDTAKADGGILTGLRDAYGLGYRTRQDLERHVDVTLDYSASDLSEVPRVLDDGQQVINDFVATREGGSSARAQITTGPTSVSPAPDGVGQREGGDTYNVYADGVLPDVANLNARYRSFDQSRIPNLAVGYHRAETHPDTAKGLELMCLDVGATVKVTDWPAYLPPEAVLLLVQGYTETLSKMLWSQKMNTTAAGPYQTGVYDVDDQVAGPTRWGSGSSTLNAGVTTTATTIVVKGLARVSTVEVWTTVSARYPLDVMIGGEQITLNSAPTGGTSPQTFNGVSRSVNGVVSAHDADDPVQLFNRTFYGL